MLYFLNSQILREEVGARDLSRVILWNLETLQTANTGEKNLPIFSFLFQAAPSHLFPCLPLCWDGYGCPRIGSILLQLEFSFLIVHQVNQVLKSSKLCHAAYENNFMLKTKWNCIKYLKKVNRWKPSCWEPMVQFGEVVWNHPEILVCCEWKSHSIRM